MHVTIGMADRRISRPAALVRSLVLGIACSAAAGCASDPTAIDVDCTVTGRYMSLRTGASWMYAVTTPNGARTKTQTVGALEDMGGAKAGTMAFRLTTTKTNGMTVSWQQDTGATIVRHREQDSSGTTQTEELYTPFRTRIDETPAHLAVGATWTETYDEVVTDLATSQVVTATKRETWTVEADDDGVRVPAGDFCALRVRRSSTVAGAPGSTKIYWFSRGVGKVKEQTDGGDTETLTSFIP